jgi:hypothetical protein
VKTVEVLFSFVAPVTPSPCELVPATPGPLPAFVPAMHAAVEAQLVTA